MKLANKYLTIFGAAVIGLIVLKNAAGFSTAIRAVGTTVNTNASTLITGKATKN